MLSPWLICANSAEREAESSEPELVGIGGGGGPGGGGGGPDPAEGPDGNPLSSFATGPWNSKWRQQSPSLPLYSILNWVLHVCRAHRGPTVALTQ